MIDEFDDREILGTAPRLAGATRAVTVQENDHSLMICCGLSECEISPTQARKLARYLNRIARRIDERNNA
jgi:hypothetical protein